MLAAPLLGRFDYGVKDLFCTAFRWLINTVFMAVAAIPIIIVFLAFQKYFTQGITMGAVKG